MVLVCEDGGARPGAGRPGSVVASEEIATCPDGARNLSPRGRGMGKKSQGLVGCGRSWGCSQWGWALRDWVGQGKVQLGRRRGLARVARQAHGGGGPKQSRVLMLRGESRSAQGKNAKGRIESTVGELVASLDASGVRAEKRESWAPPVIPWVGRFVRGPAGEGGGQRGRRFACIQGPKPVEGGGSGEGSQTEATEAGGGGTSEDGGGPVEGSGREGQATVACPTLPQ
ncbi:hypothetical protein K2173_023012 [Erythroxylum novogranatense]|uniref:Uncharacterized protein n=1 Tax=Erythroxylum novogranatense TaxID=1862640 RepID=A0AAV8T8G0_9ROSI|nr:hypothetical protein K2173_023012 [Erythroxylum novogranatense]